MNNKEITIEDKIKVLDRVIYVLRKDIDRGFFSTTYASGLCYRITSELKRQLDIEVSFSDIHLYIKDFTYDNAIKFDADNNYGLSAYWWYCGYIKADHENRLKFLKWMIERLKNGEEGD